MKPVLVDTNVLIDVMRRDVTWGDWSAAELVRAADSARLVINPIVYSELSMGFASIEALDAAIGGQGLEREPLPFAAGFLAARAYLGYRSRGGSRTAVLPDFFIGAHAAVSGYRLLTRDARRYRTSFPGLELIAPD